MLTQAVNPRIDEGAGMMAEVSRVVPRHSGERITVHGGWLSFLAVGEQTGGAYALIETANDPSTGVRLHVHEREDETWFILEGNTCFRWTTRSYPHVPVTTYLDRETCPTATLIAARLLRGALIIVTPAGFEGFWRESARLGADMAAHAALSVKYGVKFVSNREGQQ